jgi:hypothetical protein
MALWKESGQTQEAFCEAQGLNRSVFGYWRAKLTRVTKKEELPGFIPLALKPSVRKGRSIELKLPSGACVCWSVEDFGELASELQALSLL